MSTGESIKLVMLAFALGLGVPLVLQAFVTLRAVHKTVTSTKDRLERALDGLETVLSRARGSTAGTTAPGTQALTTLGAALVPAVLTAFKVWREASASTAGATTASEAVPAEDPPASTAPGSTTSSDKRENGHART